jgi:hypothetical protein
MKRYMALVFLLVLTAVFAFGIIKLFELRFEAGDVYPEYSTLRSDPLGTMAFYESLANLPGLTVRRDFSTSNHLPDGNKTTYFYIAASIEELQFISDQTFNDIEKFLNVGGRLVITMRPESSLPLPPREDKTLKDNNEPAKPPPIGERWGIEFDVVPLKRDPLQARLVPGMAQNESHEPLPATLDWHSGMVLKNSNPDWETIYSRNRDPVMIQRKVGRGSIVIATDSYLLSNEAMQRDRQSGLLAWLAGSSEVMVFDEAHLGVTEQPGVATLIRQYRLYWPIAGFVLLAALFIWKNATSLVPLDADSKTDDIVSGKDAATGFDNLLRRNIAPRDLLQLCFGEWKKSSVQTGQYSTLRTREAETAFQAENSRPVKDRDAVRAYRQIAKILQIQHK